MLRSAVRSVSRGSFDDSVSLTSSGAGRLREKKKAHTWTRGTATRTNTYPRHSGRSIGKDAPAWYKSRVEKYVPSILQQHPHDPDEVRSASTKRGQHHMEGSAADSRHSRHDDDDRHRRHAHKRGRAGASHLPDDIIQKFVAGLPNEKDAPAPDGADMERFDQQLEDPEVDMPLTKEQQEALEYVRAGKNIFLTGSAGTGKSFVLKHVIAELRKRHGSAGVHVTASTGSAAVLIGGTTVHSFAGVGLGAGDAATLASRVHANKPCVNRWRRAKALVIDEVSMIDAELFQKISYVAQRVRDNTRPFGGLQLVLSGDFFQLPPVSDGLRKFAFESEAWDNAVDCIVELKRVMRQGDLAFVNILNEVRWGNLTGKSYQELMKCQYKNSSKPNDGVAETKLHPYNVNVRAENEAKLRSLPGEAQVYKATDKIQSHVGKHSELRLVSGHSHPYASRLDQMNVEKVVTLKVGAQVMLLKNLDVSLGLCNGARGVVVSFEHNATTSPTEASLPLPKVHFACGVERVMQSEAWSLYEGEKVVAERRQIPLSLAWAVSVHKCQGMTLDRVEASLSRAFDHGMVYVALSRVKSLAGLKLTGFVPSKVTAHPAVVAFYRKLGCVPPGEKPPAWATQTMAGRDDDMKETTLDVLLQDQDGMRKVEYWGGPEDEDAAAGHAEQQDTEAQARIAPPRVPKSVQREEEDFDRWMDQAERALKPGFGRDQDEADQSGWNDDDVLMSGFDADELERMHAAVRNETGGGSEEGMKGSCNASEVQAELPIATKIPFAMPTPIVRVSKWRSEFLKSSSARHFLSGDQRNADVMDPRMARHAVLESTVREQALEKADERDENVRESASLPPSSAARPPGLASEFMPASLLSRSRGFDSHGGDHSSMRDSAVKKASLNVLSRLGLKHH